MVHNLDDNGGLDWRLSLWLQSCFGSHKLAGSHDNYCKYDNQFFQLFSSLLCLAALCSAFLASSVTRRFGHTATMVGAGLFYVIGSVLGAAATDISMVYLSRVFMGCGIGFSNQAIPLYLSEIAPPKKRGTVLLLFSVELACGLFIANLTNYLSNMRHPWGWRIPFGVCVVPAIVLTITGMLLLESPYSLIAKGEHSRARIVLQKLRGRKDVEDELRDLIKRRSMVEQSPTFKNTGQFRSLIARHHRPQLVIGMAMPFFQQMTGFDAILFYGPSIFSAAGFKDNAALYSTLITGTCALLATIAAASIVDRVGRRPILLYCSVVMLIAMVVVAIILGVGLRGAARLPQRLGILDVVVLCTIVLAYKASWGPLAWLVPSEIFPQEIRSVGQSIVVSLNMLMKFVFAQSLLSMLCAMKYGIFLFFGAWLAVMGLFTLFLIPETKGVPIDCMKELWENHWYWKQYMQTTIPPVQKEIPL
ncbi:hypothetical protein KP509_28G042000 [Ceratopteris richardii]|uniref:Major facilitator superfamily (MFS) profile domain-containing protein n=1 Tax=Ceratopteris richardii TaxID=49495 RepID=A0A8T2RDQ7_CERRI|nr:hypothetical protein KP509_28G042000 [Ceratopteris richardii]